MVCLLGLLRGTRLKSLQFMSKVTISAILTIIRIVLTLGEKLVRSIYTVIDIVDDGIINESVEKPAWYEKLTQIITTIETALRELGEVSDQIV